MSYFEAFPNMSKVSRTSASSHGSTIRKQSHLLGPWEKIVTWGRDVFQVSRSPRNQRISSWIWQRYIYIYMHIVHMPCATFISGDKQSLKVCLLSYWIVYLEKLWIVASLSSTADFLNISPKRRGKEWKEMEKKEDKKCEKVMEGEDLRWQKRCSPGHKILRRRSWRIQACQVEISKVHPPQQCVRMSRLHH